MLLFLQLSFGGCAYTNDGNAASELRQPLLQFFTVVVAGCIFNFNPDLLNATLDGVVITLTANDG